MPGRRIMLGACILGLAAACADRKDEAPISPIVGFDVHALSGEVVDRRGVREVYTLGSGDRLKITVFRHEDLSGEFDLDGGGDLALPLVGEVSAKGRTARQLENVVEAKLKEQGYLVKPQVSIEVLNYRPFYIIGEVNNPGSYQYVNGMTVINAVALAGGFTYRAEQDDILITRGSNNEEREVEMEARVLPGDIIEVPERFF